MIAPRNGEAAAALIRSRYSFAGHTLQLAFESQALRTLCEDEAHAKQLLGDKVAEMLKHRLADLDAAVQIADLLVGQPQVVASDSGSYMTLQLCDGYQMRFCANHAKNPMTDSAVDWSKVRRVKIVQVERGNV